MSRRLCGAARCRGLIGEQEDREATEANVAAIVRQNPDDKFAWVEMIGRCCKDINRIADALEIAKQMGSAMGDLIFWVVWATLFWFASTRGGAGQSRKALRGTTLTLVCERSRCRRML